MSKGPSEERYAKITESAGRQRFVLGRDEFLDLSDIEIYLENEQDAPERLVPEDIFPEGQIDMNTYERTAGRCPGGIGGKNIRLPKESADGGE